MRDWLDAHKPQASRGTHLLLAALLWSAVGAVLLIVGIRWVLQAHQAYALWLLAAAALVGAAKSRLALDRAAGRVIQRILSRGDGKCIGGFLSVRTWLVVVLMAGLGSTMRRTPVPRLAVGLLYAAVGTALLLACRHLWGAWRRPPTAVGDSNHE